MPEETANTPEPVASSTPSFPEGIPQDWGWVFGFVRTVFLAIAAFLSYLALRYTKRTYEATMKPFLQMQETGETVKMTPWSFDRAGDNTPFFRITNHSKSPAILVGLHRSWAVVPKHENPKQMIYSRDSSHQNYKSTHHIVGSGDFLEVREVVPKEIAFLIETKDMIHFYGYIVFTCIAGKNRYASRFDMVYEHSRFHTAWPKTDSAKFKYHKKVCT